MSLITITNLSFCENTDVKEQGIKGSRSSLVSKSVSKDHSISKNVFFQIYRGSHHLGWEAGYDVAIAAGAAAAIAYGGMTYTYVNVDTYTG